MNDGGEMDDSFILMGGNTYGDMTNDDSMSTDMILMKDNKKKGGKSVDDGKRGVMFRSQSSLIEEMMISKVSHYNRDEITSYWGDSNDHVLRKSELKKAVQDMYFHHRSSDRDFTKLGIEDKVGKGKTAKLANRSMSRNAVLDEQDLQYHEGILDDDLLADVYSITTRGAMKAAKAKAERLQEEINK